MKKMKPEIKVSDAPELPPVGTECEILFKECRHKGFGLFNIVAYRQGWAWVQYIGPLPNKGKYYTVPCSQIEFRTPNVVLVEEDKKLHGILAEIKQDAEFYMRCSSDLRTAKYGLRIIFDRTKLDGDQ